MFYALAMLLLLLLVLQTQWMFKRANYIFRLMIIIGVTAFISSSFLQLFGSNLNKIEFPVSTAKSIKTPEGFIYSVIVPLQRIQQYNEDGHFERGWFVDSAGGLFTIGLTEDHNIVAVSARTKQIEIFNAKGMLTQPPTEFVGSKGLSFYKNPIQSDHPDFTKMRLIDTSVVDNPPLSNQAIPLLLFTHPFMAWAFMLVGYGAASIQVFSARKAEKTAEAN